MLIDEVYAILNDLVKKEVRRLIADEKIRPDGRKPDEIRPLESEVGLLPRAHGSDCLPVDKLKHYLYLL